MIMLNMSFAFSVGKFSRISDLSPNKGVQIESIIAEVFG
jgi:hypothetical protein